MKNAPQQSKQFIQGTDDGLGELNAPSRPIPTAQVSAAQSAPTAEAVVSDGAHTSRPKIEIERSRAPSPAPSSSFDLNLEMGLSTDLRVRHAQSKTDTANNRAAASPRAESRRTVAGRSSSAGLGTILAPRPDPLTRLVNWLARLLKRLEKKIVGGLEKSNLPRATVTRTKAAPKRRHSASDLDQDTKHADPRSNT